MAASSAAITAQRRPHSAASPPQALTYASVTCSVGKAVPLAAEDRTDGEYRAALASVR
jgi:hypothetical protein